MMKIREIREIAKERGIRPTTMKKTELIRAIQKDEGNCDCYNTGCADRCGQESCLWRDDCI